jgi:PPM family protein phosphatase
MGRTAKCKALPRNSYSRRLQKRSRTSGAVLALSTSDMSMQLRAAAATDPGRVRTLNEDVYVARVDEGLFVVCDGMGGCAAGEVASRLAADAVVDALNATPSTAQGAPDEDRYLAQTSRLADAVRRSNQVVYDSARHDPRCAGMGTTLVGAWISNHVASVAHVGDSRAYLWRANRLEPLTRDHSLVELQVRAGLISREQSTQAAGQNVLVRVLGRQPDVAVDISEVPVRRGDYLLLCSDGLTRMVDEAALADAIGTLRDPQAICGSLIDAANRNGGRDNITLVVVEVRGRWWERVADRWMDTGGSRHADARAAL